jgi:hypothetical protein
VGEGGETFDAVAAEVITMTQAIRRGTMAIPPKPSGSKPGPRGTDIDPIRGIDKSQALGWKIYVEPPDDVVPPPDHHKWDENVQAWLIAQSTRAIAETIDELHDIFDGTITVPPEGYAISIVHLSSGGC